MTLPAFGRYETLALIGEGAMGSVYKARDPRLGREVAIKTVRAEILRTNPGLADRFAREAKIVARLHHPRIVQIYDFAGDYLVMELLRGRELKAILCEGSRFMVAETAGLLTSLAAALDYAHGEGVIHRDLKPANLFMDPEGRPKITDFGIAKLHESAMEGLTAEGTVMGTPHYMAPEQVRGLNVDGHADQYALAVVAYEILTRTLPFPGDSMTHIIYRVLNEPPPPLRTHDPSLPVALEEVFSRALAKQPQERFVDCRAFAAAFIRAAAVEPVLVTAGQAGRAGFPLLDDTAPTFQSTAKFPAAPRTTTFLGFPMTTREDIRRLWWAGAVLGVLLVLSVIAIVGHREEMQREALASEAAAEAEAAATQETGQASPPVGENTPGSAPAPPVTPAAEPSKAPPSQSAPARTKRSTPQKPPKSGAASGAKKSNGFFRDRWHKIQDHFKKKPNNS